MNKNILTMKNLFIIHIGENVVFHDLKARFDSMRIPHLSINTEESTSLFKVYREIVRLYEQQKIICIVLSMSGEKSLKRVLTYMKNHSMATTSLLTYVDSTTYPFVQKFSTHTDMRLNPFTGIHFFSKEHYTCIYDDSIGVYAKDIIERYLFKKDKNTLMTKASVDLSKNCIFLQLAKTVLALALQKIHQQKYKHETSFEFFYQLSSRDEIKDIKKFLRKIGLLLCETDHLYTLTEIIKTWKREHVPIHALPISQTHRVHAEYVLSVYEQQEQAGRKAYQHIFQYEFATLLQL